MTIQGTVGKSGTNKFSDVKLVQALFNLNRPRFPDVTPHNLKTDGLIGNKTIRALERFQRDVMGRTSTNNTVSDGDPVLRELMSGSGGDYSPSKLTGIMVHATDDAVQTYAAPIASAMAAHGIDSALRRRHFLAQIGHESGSLRFSEELASGEAYEGRIDLGNTQSGDGRRFKGRGLIQLTGRSNYADYSNATGIDYLSSPGLLAEDADVAADVSAWFWKTRGLNALADQDDITNITLRINGGYNGLSDRVRFYARALALINS